MYASSPYLPLQRSGFESMGKNMILILSDCAGERLALKVVLGMSLANWLKSLVLAA